MAAEQHRKPFFLFRPKFVLFCLYVAAYAWLRSAGDIDLQSISLPSPRGTEVFRMIGASPELPHWRQQLYRAVFSLPMVVEEEGRKHEGTLRELYRQARGIAGDGNAMTREAGYFAGGLQPGPQSQPRRPEYQPQPQYPQPRQYQQQFQQPFQQQFQPQPVQYPLLNEGERLIYMPTPEEQRRQQMSAR